MGHYHSVLTACYLTTVVENGIRHELMSITCHTLGTCNTKMATSRFEVKVIPEGLMARSVYDQQAREHDLGLGKLWTMETNAQTVSTAYMH